jgi:hypothetical protein
MRIKQGTLGRLTLAGLFLVCLVAIGCGSDGPKIGAVEGTVTVDGVPANTGSVVFTDAKGQTISGQIQADGKYRAVGVPVGDMKVTVTGPPTGVPAPPPIAMKDGPGSAPAGPPVKIPPKYGVAATSGLTFPVKSGTNSYPIQLTSK